MRKKTNYKTDEFRSKHAEYMRKWRKEHPSVYNEIAKRYYHAHNDNVKASQKKYRNKIREEVLIHYGGKCVCCGEEKKEFLVLDHINGGGNEHRRKIGLGGGSMTRWIRDNNFPDFFQVLCHNCNMSKSLYGYCPHQR